MVINPKRSRVFTPERLKLTPKRLRLTPERLFNAGGGGGEDTRDVAGRALRPLGWSIFSTTVVERTALVYLFDHFGRIDSSGLSIRPLRSNKQLLPAGGCRGEDAGDVAGCALRPLAPRADRHLWHPGQRVCPPTPRASKQRRNKLGGGGQKGLFLKTIRTFYLTDEATFWP